MEQPDWDARWREGQIGFHQSTVTDALEQYSEQVWGTGPWGRVFVPLCGKSLDMVFLAERADTVVGVEYVEQAVQEFFAERGLTPQVDAEPSARYEAEKYTLFAADFFELDVGDLGVIDAVFDRASLVALNAETRVKYADHMRSILPLGSKVLLVAFHYEQSDMDGPPFSVTPDEVARLFQDGFVIEHLETRDMLNDEFRARGLTVMHESVFSLTRV